MEFCRISSEGSLGRLAHLGMERPGFARLMGIPHDHHWYRWDFIGGWWEASSMGNNHFVRHSEPRAGRARRGAPAGTPAGNPRRIKKPGLSNQAGSSLKASSFVRGPSLCLIAAPRSARRAALDIEPLAGKETDGAIRLGDGGEVCLWQLLEEVNRAIDANAMRHLSAADGDRGSTPGTKHSYIGSHALNLALPDTRWSPRRSFHSFHQSATRAAAGVAMRLACSRRAALTQGSQDAGRVEGAGCASSDHIPPAMFAGYGFTVRLHHPGCPGSDALRVERCLRGLRAV